MARPPLPRTAVGHYPTTPAQCSTRRRTSSYRREPTVKACIVGDSDVGKSSFLMRYTEDRFGMVPATVSPENTIKIVEYMQFSVRLIIWDIPGQLTYRSIHPNIFRGAKVFILIYDLTKRDSFTNLNYWKSRIEDTVADDEVVYVLCGNKADRPCDRQVSEIEGRERATEWGIRHFEVSVRTGAGTDDLFKYIARQLHIRNCTATADSGFHVTNQPPNASRCPC